VSAWGWAALVYAVLMAVLYGLYRLARAAARDAARDAEELRYYMRSMGTDQDGSV